MLEGILFLAVALVFVWWQLRDLRKEREAAQKRREAAAADASRGDGQAEDS